MKYFINIFVYVDAATYCDAAQSIAESKVGGDVLLKTELPLDYKIVDTIVVPLPNGWFPSYGYSFYKEVPEGYEPA